MDSSVCRSAIASQLLHQSARLLNAKTSPANVRARFMRSVRNRDDSRQAAAGHTHAPTDRGAPAFFDSRCSNGFRDTPALRCDYRSPSPPPRRLISIRVQIERRLVATSTDCHCTAPMRDAGRCASRKRFSHRRVLRAAAQRRHLLRHVRNVFARRSCSGSVIDLPAKCMCISSGCRASHSITRRSLPPRTSS